jgi:hypothetical protein
MIRRSVVGPSLLRVVCVIVMLATPVVAQPAPDRPWAAGVSEDQQTIALEIYKEGNAEFAESRFAQALAKYRKALEHWDHPAIHFNMAVCLINLDQLLEAREHLEKSLVYGPPALGNAAHAQALTYRKLLEGRLAFVRISCREPGAEVSIDGKRLFTGPGESEQVLLPGRHQIVATKPGFVTQSETLSLSAGVQTTHDVRLIAFKSTAHTVRRWARWKPWAVIGGGALLGGAGTLFHFVAASQADRYNDALVMRCPQGCPAGTDVDDLDAIKSRAESRQAIAITLWSLGAAVAVTGTVGVLLNLPRTRVEAPRATPVVTPTKGGAVLLFMWGL